MLATDCRDRWNASERFTSSQQNWLFVAWYETLRQLDERRQNRENVIGCKHGSFQSHGCELGPTTKNDRARRIIQIGKNKNLRWYRWIWWSEIDLFPIDSNENRDNLQRDIAILVEEHDHASTNTNSLRVDSIEKLISESEWLTHTWRVSRFPAFEIVYGISLWHFWIFLIRNLSIIVG